jgi:hypothetical protein
LTAADVVLDVLLVEREVLLVERDELEDPVVVAQLDKGPQINALVELEDGSEGFSPHKSGADADFVAVAAKVLTGTLRVIVVVIVVT